MTAVSGDGTELVNYTSNVLIVLSPGIYEFLYAIPSSGIARIEEAETITTSTSIIGTPVVQIVSGKVVGLPNPEEGIFYIVEYDVATKLREEGRTDDILFPNAVVRNDKGELIGVTGWGTFASKS
mgnify:FL=1